MSIELIRADLLSWFAKHARTMAWRSNPTPWHVWVSEIMLQQTRVESVHHYFARFMARFPSPQHVASAPVEDLLDAWAGLGYYSRARNLHHACQQIVDEYDGIIPSDPEGFGSLKGVGRYTCGAVMSIAFGRAEPIVDGNVERVFSRLFLVEDNVRTTAAKNKFWSLATDFVTALPAEQQPGDLNQAIMELGALVCKPKSPTCDLCPLQKYCQAHAANKTTLLPVKSKPAPKKTVRIRAEICTDEASRVWVVRRPDTGLLAGLWSLPMAEIHEESDFKLSSPADLRVKHAFTHLIWQLDVYRQASVITEKEAVARWGPSARAMSVDELSTAALGGPSLKALIASGLALPKRRGSGRKPTL